MIIISAAPGIQHRADLFAIHPAQQRAVGYPVPYPIRVGHALSGWTDEIVSARALEPRVAKWQVRGWNARARLPSAGLGCALRNTPPWGPLSSPGGPVVLVPTRAREVMSFGSVDCELF